MSRIHNSFYSSQLMLALTPLFSLVSTLLAALAQMGLGTFVPKNSNEIGENSESEGIDESLTESILAIKLRNARDFAEMCTIFGYACEEHIVTTPDGYLLLLQRIIPTREYLNKKKSKGEDVKKLVVFIQHGLYTNSEFFMVISDAKRCLPLVLVENGYDVWLGNNRGNKYSQKHTTLPTCSAAFWDFSIDELANFDVPSFVSYILEYTNQPSLSYIGFSQGTAQAFAALSINKELNDKINVFIALAPIMRPRGYSSTILDQIVKQNPFVFRTIFGSQALFPIVSKIQRILPTSILHILVDFAVLHLLAMKNHNISKIQKLAAYSHLYCSSSVKAVIHWTQIMNHGEFIRFRKEEEHDNTKRSKFGFERYPTENITTPLVLIHGNSDSLFDTEPFLDRLPRSDGSVTRFELEGYGHIDVVWGRNVHTDVIPKVLMALPSPNTRKKNGGLQDF